MSDQLRTALIDIFKDELLSYEHNGQWFSGVQGDSQIDIESVLNKISHAYTAAGYVHRDIANEYKNAVHESRKAMEFPKRLTGQEWYDRFIGNLDGVSFSTPTDQTHAIDVAKKVAGIE